MLIEQQFIYIDPQKNLMLPNQRFNGPEIQNFDHKYVKKENKENILKSNDKKRS